MCILQYSYVDVSQFSQMRTFEVNLSHAGIVQDDTDINKLTMSMCKGQITAGSLRGWIYLFTIYGGTLMGVEVGLVGHCYDC